MDRRTFTGAPSLEVDRFFGNLPKWLRNGAIEFSWLGNVYGPIEDVVAGLGRASRSERVDLVSAFFDLGCILRAYSMLLTLPLAVRCRAAIAGIDVTPLVRRALIGELTSTRVLIAAQYLGLARGLRRCGRMPRVLLYTYENQPWEKLMLAGFRRTLPTTTLIGVQHAPLAASHLGVHPTRRQWLEGTAPDLLVTVGHEFRQRLIALGAPPERVIVGGALRFPGIVPASAEIGIAEFVGPWRVLVACSIDMHEALELSHKAVAATIGLSDVALIINFHPMVDAPFRAKLREHLTKSVDCSRVTFADEIAEEWLGKIGVLLYNASGTSFEAVSKGIPAVFVGSQLALDLDKMAGQGGLRCRNVDELRRVIVRLRDHPEFRRESVAAAQAYLRQCFATPSAQFWSDLANAGTIALGSAA